MKKLMLAMVLVAGLGASSQAQDYWGSVPPVQMPTVQHYPWPYPVNPHEYLRSYQPPLYLRMYIPPHQPGTSQWIPLQVYYQGRQYNFLGIYR